MISEKSKKKHRQDKIVSYVEKQGYVRLVDLAKELKTSEQTIRRDIVELNDAGKVRRTHGGVALETNLDAPVYLQRRLAQTAEKRHIALHVTDLIPDGASVFLDTGTTCEAIADALLIRKNLKIVTYSIRCANHFNYREDYMVAIPGGIVRLVDGSIISSEGGEFIQQFRFDYAVISVSGLSSQGELGDDDTFEVINVRSAMQKANNVILAIGSEKFGKSALITLCTLKNINTLVTDAELPKAIQKIADNHNVRVVVANTSIKEASTL